jgi:hypothetical protein
MEPPQSRAEVEVSLPVGLVERADVAADLLHTARAAFICRAVEKEIKAVERRPVLESELEEGYRANTDLMLENDSAFENATLEVLNSRRD